MNSNIKSCLPVDALQLQRYLLEFREIPNLIDGKKLYGEKICLCIKVAKKEAMGYVTQFTADNGLEILLTSFKEIGDIRPGDFLIVVGVLKKNTRASVIFDAEANEEVTFHKIYLDSQKNILGCKDREHYLSFFVTTNSYHLFRKSFPLLFQGEYKHSFRMETEDVSSKGNVLLFIRCKTVSLHQFIVFLYAFINRCFHSNVYSCYYISLPTTKGHFSSC
jgi:hypothetical protein